MFKTDKGYLILLMFFSPILGLINLLKSKDDRVLIFFGILFFGIAGCVSQQRYKIYQKSYFPRLFSLTSIKMIHIEKSTDHQWEMI